VQEVVRNGVYRAASFDGSGCLLENRSSRDHCRWKYKHRARAGDCTLVSRDQLRGSAFGETRAATEIPQGQPLLDFLILCYTRLVSWPLDRHASGVVVRTPLTAKAPRVLGVLLPRRSQPESFGFHFILICLSFSSAAGAEGVNPES
jgi:hypothetical protein